MNQAPVPILEKPAGGSGRLIATLGLAGAVAGLALVSVHLATKDAIAANKAAVLKRAIMEVLHDPARYETLYRKDGKLTTNPSSEAVYLGFDEQDRPIGFAIAAAEPGFQDKVGLIFGYDPRTQKLLGMRVLESKETPGLGDKIEKDAEFVKRFEGPQTPLIPVRVGRGKGKPGEIDMITGATISSKAVIRIINHSLSEWGPVLDRYAMGADR